MSGSTTTRVLHVVGAMNRGGAETWLMYVLRNSDRHKIAMDFMVHTDERAAYDEEIAARGAEIWRCPRLNNPVLYARDFFRVLMAHGPYNVVHSHVHFYSGYVMLIAARAGVRGRVAHSHSDTSILDGQAGPLRRVYLWVMRRLLRTYATEGFAVSDQAGTALWGPDWTTDKRWRKLYCGIDLTLFHRSADKASVRAELGIPAHARVIGHVGRFDIMKNHRLILEVVALATRKDIPIYGLLVGEGPLRRSMMLKAEELGIAERVVFTGSRADVPRLLMGGMDLFVLPSFWEGLPVSVLEAQAAGLPTVISDRVTPEVAAVPELLTWLPPTADAEVWLETCLRHMACGNNISQPDALRFMMGGNFDISTGVRELELSYGIHS